MKHLKTKLMVSVVMLLVAVLVTTTASFAWITISTDPTVEAFALTSKANENLEIALATADGNEPAASNIGDGASTNTGLARMITWGNSVDLDGLIDSVKLYPAHNDSGTVKEPTYDTDGRTKALTDFGSLDYAVGTAAATADIKYGNSTEGKTYCITVAFWLRTNLTAGDTVSATVTATTDLGTNFVCEMDPGTGTFGATTETISLAANTAKKVTFRFYVEVENLTNEDIAEDETITIDIAFDGAAADSL